MGSERDCAEAEVTAREWPPASTTKVTPMRRMDFPSSNFVPLSLAEARRSIRIIARNVRLQAAGAPPRDNIMGGSRLVIDGASGAANTPPAFGYKKLFHHRRRLAEQDLAFFLGANGGLSEIRIDLLGE